MPSRDLARFCFDLAHPIPFGNQAPIVNGSPQSQYLDTETSPVLYKQLKFKYSIHTILTSLGICESTQLGEMHTRAKIHHHHKYSKGSHSYKR